MSYTPTDWKTGDVITADKLNNMEQGIVNAGGKIMFVQFTDPSGSGETLTCEKTHDELVSSFAQGTVMIGQLFFEMGGNLMAQHNGLIQITAGTLEMQMRSGSSAASYICASGSGTTWRKQQ